MFVKAESLLAFNNPVMMFVIYSCIVMVSWFGAHYIANGVMSTGNLTSLLSYVISMMMSLMMLSMVFVMITMSSASVKRINEVLSESVELTAPTGKPAGFWWIGLHHVRTPFSGFGTRAAAQST